MKRFSQHWDAREGLRITVNHTVLPLNLRTSVALELKQEAPDLSFSEKELHETPLPLPGSLFSSLHHKHDIHRRLREAGGLLVGAASKKTQEEGFPRELWRWGKGIFVELTYPFFSGRAFPAHGKILALLNEGWQTHDYLGTTLSTSAPLFTKRGQRLRTGVCHYEPMESLLNIIATLCTFTLPLPEQALTGEIYGWALTKVHPSLLEVVERYGAQHGDPYWFLLETTTLDVRTDIFSEKVERLRSLCALDDLQHRMRGVDGFYLERAQRGYEDWIAWINAYTEDMPVSCVEGACEGSITLPHLLTAVGADPLARLKLKRVLESLTQDELMQWWCAPGALGKTGAQWMVTGMLGDGDSARYAQEQRIRERRDALTSHAGDTAGMQHSLKEEAGEDASLHQDLLTWGQEVITYVETRIGRHPRAWTTPSWTLPGLWIEALLLHKNASTFFATPVEMWKDSVPKEAWCQGTRCILRGVVTEHVQEGVEPAQEVLETHIVWTGPTFPTPLKAFCFGEATSPWHTLRKQIPSLEKVTCFKETPFQDDPLPHLPNERLLREKAFTSFYEQLGRLETEVALTEVLQSQTCIDRRGTLFPEPVYRRRRV